MLSQARYDFGPEPSILGKGTSAYVYKVLDLHLKRPVALKVFKDPRALTETELALLASLSSLGSPNLVSVLDYGMIEMPNARGTRPFIAMEYWEGKTLRDDLRSKQFRIGMAPKDAEEWVKDTSKLIEQCFSGIHQIHQKQIKHLDIKPSNIFITRFSAGDLMAAMILDFGLAAHGQVAGVRGTPPYMSPEQTLGKDLTEAADVFSMGVVAYELLTRQHPFADSNAIAQADILARNIREVTPDYIVELNPHVPESVAWVIHKALAKNPDDRPNSEQVHELLNRSNVYSAERVGVGRRLKHICDKHEAGHSEQASDDLSILEREGWAFPEIIQLRYRITANTCDREIGRLTSQAALRLSEWHLDAALSDIHLACQQRRYDLRVLRVKAEHEIRKAEQDEQDALVSEASQLLTSGYSRRAWWLLEKLANRQACDPHQYSKFKNSREALQTKLDELLSTELGWLDEVKNLIRNRRFDEAAKACNRVGIDLLRTKPVEAQELEARAQRYRPALETVLDALQVESFGGRGDLITQLEQSNLNSSNIALDCSVLVQQRNRLLKELWSGATDTSGKDAVRQLDCAEGLLRIGGDPSLERLQLELERTVLEGVVQHRRQLWLENIERLQELGDWSRVVEMIGTADDELSDDVALQDLRVHAEHQLEREHEATKEFELVLDHLRQAEHEKATAALRAMHEHDPFSVVCATALAANLIEHSARVRLAGRESDAQELESQAEALTNQYEGARILSDVRASVKPTTVADPLPIEKKPKAGSSQKLQLDDSSSHDLPEDGKVTDEPEHPPGENDLKVEKRLSWKERIFKRAGVLNPRNGIPKKVDRVATSDSDVVQWEIGPEGIPRPKRKPPNVEEN